MKGIKITLACLLLLSISCTEEQPLGIDSDLQPYFDQFVEEANKRNIELSPDQLDITLTFTNIPRDEILGQCRFNKMSPNQVEIDRFNWRKLNNETREFLIFHELGHCILDRLHRDDKFPNGNCKSIMHSTLGACNFIFVGAERDSLLNELFTF